MMKSNVKKDEEEHLKVTQFIIVALGEMFEFHRKKYVLALLLDLTTTLFISRSLLKTKIGISLYSS